MEVRVELGGGGQNTEVVRCGRLRKQESIISRLQERENSNEVWSLLSCCIHEKMEKSREAIKVLQKYCSCGFVYTHTHKKKPPVYRLAYGDERRRGSEMNLARLTSGEFFSPCHKIYFLSFK